MGISRSFSPLPKPGLDCPDRKDNFKLHIEDKIHQMTGKLLRDSEWTTVLYQAHVLISGRAQSSLNEHHIKSISYAHQVSVMSLHLLKHNAYYAYCSGVHGPPDSQQVWEQLSRTDNPQFKYWSTITELELLMCRFIRYLREGYFPVYVQVCDELCAWFHVMDHTIMQDGCQYMCGIWFSCQRQDMHAEFHKGNFVVQKITTQVQPHWQGSVT